MVRRAVEGEGAARVGWRGWAFYPYPKGQTTHGDLSPRPGPIDAVSGVGLTPRRSGGNLRGW